MHDRPDLRALPFAAVAMAAITLSPATAQAQTEEPPPTIKACWVEGSGVIYRRDTTGAPTGCQQSTHRPLEWTLSVVAPGGPTGPLTIPVPLLLTGETPMGTRILSLQNSGAGEALWATSNGGTQPTATIANGTGGGRALRVFGWTEINGTRDAEQVLDVFNNSTVGGFGMRVRGNGWTALRAVHPVTGEGGGQAIQAEARGSQTAVNIQNIGTGGGLWVQNNSATRTTVDIFNSATDQGAALYAQSRGTFVTANFENLGSAGAVRANSTSENNATGSFVNSSPAGGNGVYAESKGTFPTLEVRNTGTVNGGALNATATMTSGASINAINNATTGFGSALYAEAKGQGNTVNIQNIGTGGALRANASASFTTAEFRNAGTGSALYLENSGNVSATLGVIATGTATAISAGSASGPAIRFENTGTGDNFGLLGYAKGTFPTAQFHHTNGGVALRTFGAADINGVFSVNGSAVVNGNLQINGNYFATGTKNAVVPTSSGTREMYTEEATEVWFADYGEATLRDSVVWVPFDGTFAETIETDRPYHVFLQAYGDASIYVSRRTAEGFEVRVRGDRAALEAIDFSYRLVAKRRGYGDRRLRPHTATPTDGLTTPGARQ